MCEKTELCSCNNILVKYVHRGTRSLILWLALTQSTMLYLAPVNGPQDLGKKTKPTPQAFNAPIPGLESLEKNSLETLLRSLQRTLREGVGTEAQQWDGGGGLLVSAQVECW